MESFVKGNSKLDSIVIDMDILINTFVEVQDQDLLPASVEKFEDSTNIILDSLLFELLEIESVRENFIKEAEAEEVKDLDDKFIILSGELT